MQLLGELAFIAFIVAVGRELYRWLHRGRVHSRQMLAISGCNPGTERPHVRVAARLLLGAIFFFLLYLIPTLAHAADPLTDDPVEAAGGVTEEISSLSGADQPIAIGGPIVEKVAGAGGPAEEPIRSTVLEVVEESVSSPPAAPGTSLEEGISPLPEDPEKPHQKQPSTGWRRPGSIDVGVALEAGRDAGSDRHLAGSRASRERMRTGAPPGDLRVAVVDRSSPTLSKLPDVIPARGLDPVRPSTFTAGSASTSPLGTGLFAEVITAALLGLALLWCTCSRRARGYLHLLGPPLARPG